jgi:hypothetical protein
LELTTPYLTVDTLFHNNSHINLDYDFCANPMHPKIGAPWLTPSVTMPWSSVQLPKTSQKRVTLFTIDHEGRLHADDKIAVISHDISYIAPVQFIHELSLMSQQPLVCETDESEQLQCSVCNVPKKLLVCVSSDERYGIFAAELG